MTKFLKLNNPRLRKISKEIPVNQINSPQMQKIIKTMLKVAYGEQKNQNKPIMVGLAAPQIGILKRIILVDVAADGKGKVGDLRVYINPEIIWVSQRKGERYEGCYSTGKICGIVSRPTSIKIRAISITPRGCDIAKTRCVRSLPHPRWDITEEKWTGYVARIFQHEIDHLNGRVFINHITNPDHLHLVEEKEFPLYRNQQAWKTWPKKYPLPLA